MPAQYFFRMLGGDFLDIHAAFGRSDEGDLLRGAVGDQRDVQFVLDVGAVFDVQAADLLALSAGLVGDQLHAQNVGGAGLDVGHVYPV